MTPLVVVLSAPSGAGKTTIAHRLVSVRKDVGVSVSATTRPARRGEKDGKAYYFMPREKFERLRERGDFDGGHNAHHCTSLVVFRTRLFACVSKASDKRFSCSCKSTLLAVREASTSMILPTSETAFGSRLLTMM